MNERIKELAREAHAFANRDPRANITVHLGDIFEKKFAELIVRECAESMPQENLKQMVLKRFGVEE